MLMVLAALLGVSRRAVAAQVGAFPPDLPVEEFQAREQTARWLLRYDWAAWKSTDVAMQASEAERAKLGPEWYCTGQERRWDCYYGSYDPVGDRFDAVIHLESKDGGAFVRNDARLAAADATTYARALFKSRGVAPVEVRTAGVRFNQYVRRTGNGQLEVWYLPGGQPDGRLVFGGELRVTLDPTGAEILSSVFTSTGLRASKPNPDLDLSLNNEHDDIPTVGNLFFVLQFGGRFKSVTVVGRRYVTRLVRSQDHDTWVTSERQAEVNRTLAAAQGR